MTTNIQYFVNKLLHEHKSGFQVLMTCLNSVISFIWDGILSHNFESMYDKLSNPWLTVLARSIAQYELFLILYWLCCLTGKVSSKITGLKPLKTLNNSTASVLRFLWCIETDPSFSKRSLKHVFFCHYKVNEDIFHGDDLSLLLVRLWHIQTSWQ